MELYKAVLHCRLNNTSGAGLLLQNTPQKVVIIVCSIII
jgi:hypothetical protein